MTNNGCTQRRTLVAIGAHHDDVEVRSGGTLAKYVRNGWRVVYVVACTTPYYFPTDEQKKTGRYLSNEEAIALREGEARQAAGLLGIPAEDIHFWRYKSLYWYQDGTHDRQYFDGVNHGSKDVAHYLEGEIRGRGYIMAAHHCEEEKKFLREFLAACDPAVVVTHHPDDGHWEHFGVCLFVCQVLRQMVEAGARVKGYSWGHGGAKAQTVSFGPTHFEDIGETLDVKCEALKSFLSQFPDHDTGPFLQRARAHARFWGKLAGVEYAEAFMPLDLTWKCGGFSDEIQLPAGYRLDRARLGLLAD